MSDAQGGLSTRSERCLTPRAHLDALTLNVQHVERMDLGKTAVQIIDAEADLVGHMRRWDSKIMRNATYGE